MEIASHEQEDDCHFAGRTLSDISIASNASGKGSNFGGIRHVQDTRVKFLCSHGGKILPRPSDKKLRYVGGETRMISLPRHIHFNAFQLKMVEIYGSDVALRYQLPEEDLDALVSVASDEDLENMMEECDRLDAMEGSSRLRVFVFSASDLAAGDLNVIADPKQYEQRYVDAVNTVQIDVSVRQNDSFVPSDPLKYPAGVQISHACNNQPMQEKVPGNFQAFQVEQFMPSGIYSTSNLPIGSNILGPIVPPPRQQVTRHWNELASCQHVGIINSHGRVPTNAEDFIDIESVESAASSTSSHHDLYHRYRSANTTQFLSHPELVANKHADIQLVGSEQHNILDAKVPSGVLNNMPNARFGGPISPARSFPDLAEQMYGSEAIGEVKNLVHEMNDDQPLSPGAMLQRQLQADQCTESGLHVRKEAMQVPLDGIVQQPTQTAKFLEQQEQIKQLPVHTWATVSTREAPGQMLSDYSKLPSEVFPLTSGVPMPCITPSVRPPLIEKTPDAGIQALPLQQLSVHEASIVMPQIDYTKMNGNGTIGISYLAAPPTAEVLSIPHLQNSATNMSKIDEKKQPNGLLEQMMISPVVFPDQRVLDAVDYGYQNQANWLASELASLPLENTEACAALGQSDKVMNASVFTNNQVVGTGLSLIDEPVDQESRHLSDAFLGRSAAFRDCSTIDMVSGVLPSGPLTTYSARITSQAENLVSASFSSLGRLHQEADVSEVTDLPHSIGGLHRESGDQSLLKQSAYLGDSRETESHRNGIAGIVVREGGETTAEASQTFNFLAPTSPSETWGTCLQTECKEHASILHVSHEHELKVPQSSLIIEEELTTENSMVEIEVTDTPSNAAALAEAEAIARGLQTIRNCDLEELRELGSGTFGTVYHGKWRGTDVAIKRIKSSCFTGRASERERLIADFWHEAFILGQLHHPNVVAFYGVVPDGPDGTLATVTEFMVNGSLKQAIHKKDRSVLDRQKRLLIAMDAAFGMEYLHKKNVVHFDLKCENLLVNLRDPQRPICKVGDLGLSKVKQQTMISGGVRGTLPWMAPELLNGSSSLVSEKVDIFSFGIVLWELLTGEEPYADMHYGAIIGGIVTNTLRPPVPRWCDAAWKSLMEACWSADPAERPTFTEIASSLRAMEASLQNATKGQGQAAGAG